jgi:hypothetical protein
VYQALLCSSSEHIVPDWPPAPAPG